MWINKTEDELRIDNSGNIIENFIIRHPIIFAISISTLIFFILMIGELFIGEKSNFGPIAPLQLKNLSSRIPYYFCVSFIIFIYVYFWYLRPLKHRNKISPNSYVCDKCNKIIKDKSIINCECGGVFVDIELMKWVDDVIENQ